jgi:hypothetical protein
MSRYFDIGRAARDGEYCDICKKTIYFNIWGHIEAHRRQFQREEDERASREASEDFIDTLRKHRR